jgi:hypothetical protein
MSWEKVVAEKDKDLFEFSEKGHVLQGVLVGIEKDVGEYHKTMYRLQSGDMRLWSFWGNTQLDALLKGKVGKRLRVTLVDPEFKFKKGPGKFYEVEQWKDD